MGIVETAFGIALRRILAASWKSECQRFIVAIDERANGEIHFNKTLHISEESVDVPPGAGPVSDLDGARFIVARSESDRQNPPLRPPLQVLPVRRSSQYCASDSGLEKRRGDIGLIPERDVMDAPVFVFVESFRWLRFAAMEQGFLFAMASCRRPGSPRMPDLRDSLGKAPDRRGLPLGLRFALKRSPQSVVTV
jgi:hypothetical protein